jgi:hypothetical protein
LYGQADGFLSVAASDFSSEVTSSDLTLHSSCDVGDSYTKLKAERDEWVATAIAVCKERDALQAGFSAYLEAVEKYVGAVEKNDQYFPGRDAHDRQNKVDTSAPFGEGAAHVNAGHRGGGPVDWAGVAAALPTDQLAAVETVIGRLASGVITPEALCEFCNNYGVPDSNRAEAPSPRVVKSGGTLQDAVARAIANPTKG